MRRSRPQKARKVQEYDVHDNGGRPFRVVVAHDKRVDVYAVDPGTDDVENFNPSYSKLVASFSPDVIMLGSQKPKGNTVLLKTGDKYVYIGEAVKEFTPRSPIVKYSSPVGNSDVPYPFAVDENGDAYLMIEDTVVQNYAGKDPYTHYYSEKSDTRKLRTKTLVKSPY